MRRGAAGLLAGALALALASAAPAALPSPSSDAIVVGHSIGGVAIGQTLARARAAWGPGASCRIVSGSGTCEYEGSSTSAAVEPAYGGFVVRHGRVVEVHIDSAFVPDTQTYETSGALTGLRTSAGIGIGASIAAVRRAYPKARARAGGLIYALTSGAGADGVLGAAGPRVGGHGRGARRVSARSRQCQAVVCQLSVGDSGASHGGSFSAT